MTNIPQVGYVVLEVDYHEDRDEPIHSFVSSPFATREEAERQRDKRKEAYREYCEEKGELYDAKDFSVTELHISSDQLTPMDEERYKTMSKVANAVAENILRVEK